MASSYPPSLSTVLMYIDDSNIFEGARRYSGIQKGYRDGVPDVPCRIMHEKMIAIARAKRKLLLPCKMYTSQEKEFGVGKHVEVKRFKRSEWTHKEKQVDTALTADAVEDMILMKELAGTNPTIILFSGDKDLTPVVDKAIDHGYNVEIWAFKEHLNQEMKHRAEEAAQRDHDTSKKITFYPIDDILKEISFTEYERKETCMPPPNRSLMATLSIPRGSKPSETVLDMKTGILKHLVDKASNILKLPFVGKFQNNENDSAHEHLLLVGLGSAKPRLLCEKCQELYAAPRCNYYTSHQHIQMLERELGKGKHQSTSENMPFLFHRLETYTQYLASLNQTTAHTRLQLNNRFQILDPDGVNVQDTAASLIIMNPDPEHTTTKDSINPQLFQSQDGVPGSDDDFGGGDGGNAWEEVKPRNKFRNPKRKVHKSKRHVELCRYGFECHNPDCKFKHSAEEQAYFQRSQKNMKLRAR